mgnify:FL=1
MKKLIIGLALFLAACVAVPDVGHTMNYQGLRDTTYQISMDWGNCSAVAISPTELLTAAHCVTEVGEQFKIFDGTPNDKVFVGTATAVKDKDDIDLALLILEKGKTFPVYASLASREPLRDEIVVVVGYPMDVQEVLTVGRWQGYSADMQLVTAQAVFGNSGGPMFIIQNGKYVLAGIGSQVMGISGVPIAYLSFFVTLDNIVDFLGIHPKTS